MGRGNVMSDNNYGIPYIKPFHFWVQHVLPLTYDDSLSYLEVLEKVKIKLNEVIANINSWSDMIKNYTDQQIALAKTELLQYIDQQDSELRAYINAQLGDYRLELNNAIAKLNADMEALQNAYQQSDRELRAWVAEQILALNNSYGDFVKQVNILLDSLRDLIYSQDDLIYQEIDKQVKYLEGLIAEIQLNPVQKVIDPVDLKIEDIQVALNHMFYNLNSWGLRAVNYDQLLLTAQEYDDYNLGAWNYDYLGKWYLREKPRLKKYIDNKIIEIDNKYFNLVYDYSPFTGKWDTLVNILRMVVQIISLDSLTAHKYDSLELTATQYDNWEWGENEIGLTAFMYDWYGTILLPESENGLEAQIYDNLKVQGWHIVTDKYFKEAMKGVMENG